MPTAQSADGVLHQFPEGTDPAVIDRVMKQYQADQGVRQGGMSRYLGESAEALGEGVKGIAKGGAEFVGDLFRSLVQGGKPGAEAGGRVLGKLGDVAQFASGGGVGPTMPPTGRPISTIAEPATAAQRGLQDFRQLDMTPSRPALTQRTAPITFAARSMPFSPVQHGLEQNVREAGQAAEGLAGRMGQAQTGAEAGAVAQNAMRRFAADTSQAEADYGEFWRNMHGAAPAQLPNTLRVLQNLKGRFPSAPGLVGLFTSPRLARMEGELSPRTTQVPAQMSSILDEQGKPIVTRSAYSKTTGGMLSAPELKELQSHIGRMLENPGFGPDDIPKGQVKQLYGALKTDLQAAAARQGPAAVRSLAAANTRYAQRMDMIERLQPLLKPDNPERSFARLNAAACSSGAGHGALLETAKKTMTPQEWNEVGAATIRRLGFPAGQAADAEGAEFSL